MLFSDYADFVAGVENVTFEASTNSSSVSCAYFEILEDRLAFEGTENFTVTLEETDVAMIGENSTALVSIRDNDGKE